MAHPVIPESLLEPTEKPKVRVVEKIVEVTKKIGEKTPGILDSLTLLVIAFLYFFFTGLALLFKKELPKEWLKIASQLNKGRVAKLLRPKPEEVVKPKGKITVRDIATGQRIKPLSITSQNTTKV